MVGWGGRGEGAEGVFFCFLKRRKEGREGGRGVRVDTFGDWRKSRKLLSSNCEWEMGMRIDQKKNYESQLKHNLY